MFSLVYTRDGQTIRHVLSAGDTIAGRAPRCDLVIEDPSISRRHARFRVHGGRCQVTELEGRNGTFINGQRITEGDLQAGDTVVLGRVPLQVQPWEPAEVGMSERHRLLDEPSTVQRLVPGPAAASPEVAPDLEPRRLLELVREIAVQLVGWRSHDDALDRIVSVAFATTAAERGFLLLVDAGTGARVLKVARMRDGEAMDATTLNREVIDRVLDTGESMMAVDAQLGPTQSARIEEDSLRSLICVPLSPPQRSPIGVLYVDRPRASSFTPGDLKVLEALGVYGAAAAVHAAPGLPTEPPTD